MAEVRLIYANEVIEGMEELMRSPWYNDAPWELATKKEALSIVKELCIQKATTVDAVEVVRCRECKNWKDGLCKLLCADTEEDGYCSWGAKMDATDNNVGHKDGGADNE